MVMQVYRLEVLVKRTAYEIRHIRADSPGEAIERLARNEGATAECSVITAHDQEGNDVTKEVPEKRRVP